MFILGKDMGVMGGVFGATAGPLAQFGESRVIDAPIEIMFGDLLGCAGDRIINQVAKARHVSGGKARVPLTICVTTGASGAAAAQRSQSPESWFLNVPGKIVAPADAKGLLKSAIRGKAPRCSSSTKRSTPPRAKCPMGISFVLRQGFGRDDHRDRRHAAASDAGCRYAGQ
jgi:pyruvate/2-oxoglutarate/acetoin dehydrogenase E1 component